MNANDNNRLPPEYYYNIAGNLCCDEVLEDDTQMHQETEVLTISISSTSEGSEDLAISLSNSLEANLQKPETTAKGIPIARVIGQPRVRRDNLERESVVQHLSNNDNELEITQFGFDEPNLNTPRPSIFQGGPVQPIYFPPTSPPGYSDLEDREIIYPPENYDFSNESSVQYLSENNSPLSPRRAMLMLNPNIRVRPPRWQRVRNDFIPSPDSGFQIHADSNNFMHYEQNQTINVFPSPEHLVVPQQQAGDVMAPNMHVSYYGGPNGMGMQAPLPYQEMTGSTAMPPNEPVVTTASWTNL